MVSPDTYPVHGAVSWVTPFRLADDDTDELLLLDCQPKIPEYINGHIPRALNLPWKGPMIQGNARKLRPLAEVRAGAIGATPDKTILCSCGTGREPTNEFLISRSLIGYLKVLLYGVSFPEWLSRPEYSTATGPNPG